MVQWPATINSKGFSITLMLNSTSNHSCDIAIIGSGIVGSTLGAVLARQGLRVIIFEAKSHPRFSIGESMILETSETMRALAEMYDVPELAYYSSEYYLPYVGTNHGVKRHFSYLHHQAGKLHVPAHTLQAVIPKQPHGHELHLYRQEVDQYFMTCAIQYGATVLQNTPVSDIDFTDDYVAIMTKSGESYQAKFIVDAGGFRSPIATKFNLRDFDLQTHSRAIFTHMVDVPDFHDIGTSQTDADVPFSVAEGTLHHVFDGGWLWVIPFNNHSASTNPLCSVGLLLDPRVYPSRPELTPEAEFFTFIEQFPSISAQFREAKAVRDWVRTGRIQYSSKQVVGDRWALLGHAAGFIDPLYSKGLYISLACVTVLAHLLLQACRENNFTRTHFLPLEQMTLAYIHNNDRLVANSYKSWGDNDLWHRYSVLWLLGAYTELVKLFSIRISSTEQGKVIPQRYVEQLQHLKLSGGGFAGYDDIADRIDTLVRSANMRSKSHVTQTIEDMKEAFATINWMPIPFQAVLEGKTHLPKRKIRLDLLKKGEGFLRSGDYRTHFFGNYTMWQIGRVFWQEFMTYSKPSLARQRYRK